VHCDVEPGMVCVGGPVWQTTIFGICGRSGSTHWGTAGSLAD
jgi:hypothetical protein